MGKEREGIPRARAAARKADEAGSALEIFRAEDTLFEARPLLEVAGPEFLDARSSPLDPRSSPSEGRADDDEIDDADVKRVARPGWLVSWIVVALIVVAIPVGFAITLLAVAMPFGVVWSVYMGLIQPVLRTEAAVIVLNPAPRLMVFAAWLLMVGVGAVALTRGGDSVRGRIGFGDKDSVAWAIATSVSSVLVAFGLSSWVVQWLLRFVR